MAELFFSGNYSALAEFRNKLEAYKAESPDDQERVKLLTEALNVIESNRAIYDELSPLTSERIGKHFLEALKKPLDEEIVLRILVYVAQFIREVTLQKSERIGAEQQILNYFIGMPVWSRHVFDGFSADFIRHGLPFDMLLDAQQRAGVLREEMVALGEKTEQQLSRTAESAQIKIEDLAKQNEVSLRRLQDAYLVEINDLEGRISGYKDSIRNLASAYNFAGLSHAFEKLIDGKTKEKWFSGLVVLCLGVALISLPALSLYFGNAYLSDVMTSGWSPSAVAHLVAAAAIEIIVLYFFRVALKAYLLARTQITNLQLRLSICSFIEGYRDFVRDSKTRGDAEFGRFEDLVFSQLPTDDGKLPATIEGIEHVSSIIQALKKAT